MESTRRLAGPTINPISELESSQARLESEPVRLGGEVYTISSVVSHTSLLVNTANITPKPGWNKSAEQLVPYKRIELPGSLSQAPCIRVENQQEAEAWLLAHFNELKAGTHIVEIADQAERFEINFHPATAAKMAKIYKDTYDARALISLDLKHANEYMAYVMSIKYCLARSWTVNFTNPYSRQHHARDIRQDLHNLRREMHLNQRATSFRSEELAITLDVLEQDCKLLHDCPDDDRLSAYVAQEGASFLLERHTQSLLRKLEEHMSSCRQRWKQSTQVDIGNPTDLAGLAGGPVFTCRSCAPLSEAGARMSLFTSRDLGHALNRRFNAELNEQAGQKIARTG